MVKKTKHINSEFPYDTLFKDRIEAEEYLKTQGFSEKGPIFKNHSTSAALCSVWNKGSINTWVSYWSSQGVSF